MFYAPKYIIDKEQGYSPFNFAISTRLKESEKDIRLSYSIYSPLEESAASPIFKYAGSNWSQNSTGRSSYIYRSSTSNWIVYRLSDLMLMKAESLVQKAKLLEQASVDGEEEDSRIQIYLTDACYL